MVGEEGIEPSAFRTRSERSTDDLLPETRYNSISSPP